MKKILCYLIFTAALLTGCSTAKPIEFSGESTTENPKIVTTSPTTRTTSTASTVIASTTTLTEVTTIITTTAKNPETAPLEPVQTVATSTHTSKAGTSAEKPEATSTAATCEATAKLQTANGADAVRQALPYIGKTDYVFGGESFETGLDCSGLSVVAYRNIGVEIPHSAAILTGGKYEYVDKYHLLPGDVMGTSDHAWMFAGWADLPTWADVCFEDENGDFVNMMELSSWELVSDVNLGFYKSELNNPDRAELMIPKNQLASYEFIAAPRYYRSEWAETTIRIGLVLEISPGKLVLGAIRYEDWTSGGYRVCDNTAPSAEFPEDITKYPVT